MKVAQVLYSGLGGHGSVVSSLVLADNKAEWRHQLVFYGIEDLLPAYRNFCLTRSIQFVYIRKRKGLFRLPGFKIFRAFSDLSPDILILHSPTLVLPAWFFCLLHRKKLFVVEHTPHVTKGKAERMASLLSLLLARKVVCLSESYRTDLKKQIPYLNIHKRTVVIRNGIDLDRFRPVPVKDSPEFHIGMAGRFSSQKNQALLIEAAILGFSGGQLDKQVHFHFAGSGETLEQLKQLITEKGLDKQVHFHGLLEEKEMLAFFSRLDLYVHASFAETMCTSVMQAMACSLPVIGSDIPGINDLLPAGDQTICLLPNARPQSWLEQILIYKDRERRIARSIRSREAAELYFSAADSFSAYTQLITNG